MVANPDVPRRGASKTSRPPEFPMLVPFTQRLQDLRIERGITQAALARRAGISVNHCQDIAHANANPSLVVLLKLADALGVPPADLLPYSNDGRFVATTDLEDLLAGFT